MASTVGLSIREAREEKGWTQTDLAERAHVSRLTVSYWENGHRTPRAKRLQRLARLLDRTVAWSGSELVLAREAA